MNEKEFAECALVEILCSALKLGGEELVITPLGENDPPDVEFKLEGKVIGVECTRYNSNAHLDNLIGAEKQSPNYRSFQLKNTLDRFCEQVAKNTRYSILRKKVREIRFAYDKGVVKLLPNKKFKSVENELFDLLENRNVFSFPSDANSISKVEIQRSKYENLPEYVDNISLGSGLLPICSQHAFASANFE